MEAADTATERTPLLLGRRSSTRPRKPDLPAISALESTLAGSSNPDYTAALASTPLPSQSAKTALSLILSFRHYLRTQKNGLSSQVVTSMPDVSILAAGG